MDFPRPNSSPWRSGTKSDSSLNTSDLVVYLWILHDGLMDEKRKENEYMVERMGMVVVYFANHEKWVLVPQGPRLCRDTTLCLSLPAFLTPGHHSVPGHLQQCLLLVWQTREPLKPISYFLCSYGLFLSCSDMAFSKNLFAFSPLLKSCQLYPHTCEVAFPQKQEWLEET